MSVRALLAEARGKKAKEALIAARLADALKRQEWWKRLAFKCRCLAAGDYSPIDWEAIQQAEPTMARRLRRSFGPQDIYEIATRDIETGVSNYLGRHIALLADQTSNGLPEVHFSGIDPLEATLNMLYIKSVFQKPLASGPASAQMSLALLDYLICGWGCVYSSIGSDGPFVRYVDPVSEVLWDPEARAMSDWRWCALTEAQSISAWVELFGEPQWFDDLINPHGGPLQLDQMVELVYYWDREGSGVHAIARLDKVMDQGDEASVLLLEDNPHVLLASDGERPFLPLIPIAAMQMPGARMPRPLVVDMAPHQAMTAFADRQIRDQITRLRDFWEAESGAYEPEEILKLEGGENGQVIYRNAQARPMELRSGSRINPEQIQVRNMHQREIIEASGSNPYSLGGVAQGVKFATEANQIAAQAGLRATTVSRAHADHWREVSLAVLAIGQMYDMRPFSLNLDGNELQFGPDNPIGRYLRLTEDVSVSESSLRYQNQEQKLAQAQQKLAMALQVQSMFPNSLRLAYEDCLVAAGETDLARHFEQPQQSLPAQAQAAAQMVQQ